MNDYDLDEALRGIELRNMVKEREKMIKHRDINGWVKFDKEDYAPEPTPIPEPPTVPEKGELIFTPYPEISFESFIENYKIVLNIRETMNGNYEVTTHTVEKFIFDSKSGWEPLIVGEMKTIDGALGAFIEAINYLSDPNNPRGGLMINGELFLRIRVLPPKNSYEVVKGKLQIKKSDFERTQESRPRKKTAPKGLWK